VKNRKNWILKAAARAAGLLPAGIKKVIYRIPFLSGFIRKWLNAAAPEGQQEVIIAGGVLKGMRLSLDLQTEKDYWLGTYETDLQAASGEFIQPGMTVYDVGANIGYISLIAARLAGDLGKVFSFEALPANIERLRENVRLNGLEEQVNIIHAAVIDQSGETEFFTHASGAMGKAAGSAGRDSEYGEIIHVRAVTLDDFIFTEENPVPDVIKMDIEGGEKLAVKGMVRTLSEYRPILLIELHGEEAARTMWDTLTTCGYSIHAMHKGYPLVQTLDHLDWKAYIIAMPNPIKT
jgi:FkbM family methyltransferase